MPISISHIFGWGGGVLQGGWQPVNDPYGGGKSATVAAGANGAAPAVAPADYPASATAYNESI